MNHKYYLHQDLLVSPADTHRRANFLVVLYSSTRVFTASPLCQHYYTPLVLQVVQRLYKCAHYVLRVGPSLTLSSSHGTTYAVMSFLTPRV